MLRVVNFFGGPGSGKSTMAAAVFSLLKWSGNNVELVTEYAKDLVYEHLTLDQFKIAGEQYHRLWRLDSVDIAVTDSPLLLSTIYGAGYGEEFKNVIMQRHKEFDNLNFFLERTDRFSEVGRIHSKAEAEELDKRILAELEPKIKLYHIPSSRRSLPTVYNLVNRFIKRSGRYEEFSERTNS